MLSARRLLLASTRVNGGFTLIRRIWRRGGLPVVGVRAGEYGRQFPERGRAIRDEIWRWAAEGLTRPTVFAELPLDRWREAFDLMRDRRLVGKVVLRP